MHNKINIISLDFSNIILAPSISSKFLYLNISTKNSKE